jgi:hypothetical protein
VNGFRGLTAPWPSERKSAPAIQADGAISFCAWKTRKVTRMPGETPEQMPGTQAQTKVEKANDADD